LLIFFLSAIAAVICLVVGNVLKTRREKSNTASISN